MAAGAPATKPVDKSGLKVSSPWKGFAFSAVACCTAECVTIPVDVVKTRLQLQGELGATRQYTGAFNAASTMLRTEGLRSLFKGVTPALLRQATYGTLRYGLYEPIKDVIGTEPGKPMPLWKKIVAGTLAGAISSSLCNPTDLVKVRMQAAQGTQRYKNTFSAFGTIARQEGFWALYRGVGPTCARASVGAATELAIYDELKTMVIKMWLGKDGLPAHLTASLIAGFISTVAISPFDVIKSRVMNQPVDAQGKGLRYSGMIDCGIKSMQKEGLFSLWKGFWPNYGPRVVIIFVLLEQLRMRFD